jgi:hypothetical protein
VVLLTNLMHLLSYLSDPSLKVRVHGMSTTVKHPYIYRPLQARMPVRMNVTDASRRYMANICFLIAHSFRRSLKPSAAFL